MEPLAFPPKEKLREIAARQDAKEEEIRRKREAEQSQAIPDPRRDAAQTIQASLIHWRNYRGYRQRREFGGHNLSSTARWSEAIKAAELRRRTKPRAKREDTEGESPARRKWKRAAVVARQAQNDDTSDTDGEHDMTPEELERHRERKRAKKAEREKYAQTMGLKYFLEMVDQKHRYGSTLRKYHAVWQESDTKENFFYWLDHGEGLNVDLEERPRKRLDEERIRYLSKEERKRYQVEVDAYGLFRWARNGELITTSAEFKDSIDGIVPADSDKPTWREVQQGKTDSSDSATSDNDDPSDSSITDISAGSQEDDDHYTNHKLRDAKGLSKLKYISAGALMNRMLRKTTKKNTWIFVCDTSCRMYLGIKQSGAFQHSSFLHGGRVSAAGLMQIKRGQLRKLDPLSGHYAPPTRNFRGFVRHLRDVGVDMDRVSISRSYGLILGLEGYVKAKDSITKGGQKIKDIAHPQQAREREAAAEDKTESAKKERAYLAAQRTREQEEEPSLSQRLTQKLSIDGPKKDLPVGGRGTGLSCT